ncbi:MAG: lipoprotein-releasing ABC transporter permease subunit [Desulfuromonadaceae bacterium]|nr:lipoprotein-releasing ABC transporter permease subunit [Desulfuromonadaceae bacterium]
MRYEWLISLRYLRAKRKQTFISVISFISVAGVTLGVAALILVLAIMTGFHDGVRQQILGNIPHILVQKHGGNLTDWSERMQQIQDEFAEVRSVEPFVTKEAMLLVRENVAPVKIKGVRSSHPVLQQRFVTRDEGSVVGALFEPSGNPPGIVIAADTAASLGVSVGERLSVIPPDFSLTPFGVIPKVRVFEVVAIARHRGGFLDAYYAYIQLEEAQRFIGSPDGVSGLEVELSGFDQTRQVVQKLSSELTFPYSVRSWEDLFGSFLAALKLEKLGLFIVLAIIVLVAAFNIGTTLIMVVMEKHKDIAILRSMGATSTSILKIFVFEGLLIGVAGTALGSGLGLTLALNADAMITWLERCFDVVLFDHAVYGMDHFPSQVVMADVTAVVVTALSICLLATVYPALRAARLDPAESLRYE